MCSKIIYITVNICISNKWVRAYLHAHEESFEFLWPSFDQNSNTNLQIILTTFSCPTPLNFHFFFPLGRMHFIGLTNIPMMGNAQHLSLLWTPFLPVLVIHDSVQETKYQASPGQNKGNFPWSPFIRNGEKPRRRDYLGQHV